MSCLSLFFNYAVNMPFNAVKMAIFTWESVGFDFSSQPQVANKYSIFFNTTSALGGYPLGWPHN